MADIAAAVVRRGAIIVNIINLHVASQVVGVMEVGTTDQHTVVAEVPHHHIASRSLLTKVVTRTTTAVLVTGHRAITTMVPWLEILAGHPSVPTTAPRPRIQGRNDSQS